MESSISTETLSRQLVSPASNMDSDNDYEPESGEDDSYDYTGEESNPEMSEEMTEEVMVERCRFDWQDEELDNKERGE